MVGYEMRCSPTGVYSTTVETPPVSNFKHGCQHGNTFLLGGVL